ncbi:MAG TPA: type IV pilus modification protein PilV [Moraxellaceae bacterium]
MSIPAEMKMASHQRGVGLIEVLVAMVILGVVVLGFAAMQMRAVGMTGDSYARSQAMSIAQDLVERMSVNYLSAGEYLSAYSGGAALTPLTTLANNCLTSTCTSAQLATFDIEQARYYAAALLPEGLVYIRRDAGASENIQVFVAWGGTNPVPGISDNACMTTSGTADLQMKVDANCVMIETPLVEVGP